MKPLKIICAIFLIGFCVVFSNALQAQTADLNSEEHGGVYPMQMNDAIHPCITREEYETMERQVQENVKKLKLTVDPAKRTTLSTTFSWPLIAASGLNDCGYYIISNYVDQDPTTGIKDYNCGSVTYDGHRGTDIATYPYHFYKMDNNQVNVVAAAPGTIVAKSDGFFDRNCAMGSATANYIIIQHADGSQALYWHFKEYSLTTKIVGETVSTGEFLAVVGSSGSSTGPHLHFEVWANSASTSLNDPWAGSCNLLNSSTWWVSQKPYTEPAIVKVQTNNIPPVFPGCDTTETLNEDSCFSPGATAKLYIFIRNETPGMTANLSILNPDGSTFTSWIHNSTVSYIGSYWWWNKVMPTVPGRYTFKAIYNGITCSKTFIVNCASLGVAATHRPSDVQVFPNPANSMVNISLAGMDNGNYKLVLRNTLGQLMWSDNVTVVNGGVQKDMPVSALPCGIYFLSVESDKIKIVKKIIKNN